MALALTVPASPVLADGDMRDAAYAETGDKFLEDDSDKETSFETDQETGAAPETDETFDFKTETEENDVSETKMPETEMEKVKRETKKKETEKMSDSETETASETETESGTEERVSIDFEDYGNIGLVVQFNVDVPIEGLPTFVTQEMVSAALKCREETGAVTSVILALMFKESGFGTYGPGGVDAQGLTQNGYENHNLFNLTSDGSEKQYHTYADCFSDLEDLLALAYADVILENADNTDDFRTAFAKRWSDDAAYAAQLKEISDTYQLERLDTLTLAQFSEMIGPYANPCPGTTISSGFGFRSFDNAVHYGVDLATGGVNVPTYAVKAGTVITAGFSESAGNWVVIDHGDGIVTKYMHHAAIYVCEGQKVFKGQQLGLTGTTGYSTGIHLHFQLEIEGAAADPLPYIQQTSSVPAMAMIKTEASKK